MLKTNRFRRSATFLLLCSTLALAGCRNGNLFGGLHSRGDSGSVENLKSEAAVALQQRDYGSALDLYNRILAQDPTNSEALYGSAAAQIGGSGLNIANLITNVSRQSSSAATLNSLGDLVGQSREKIHASSIDPNSLLAGVDLDALSHAIDPAICHLNRIVAGLSDEKIKHDDVDVMLNLAVLYVLRAAVRPLNAGYIDIQNVAGDYTVVVDPSLSADNVCTNNPSLVLTMARDIIYAWALFNRSAAKLGLPDNSTKIIGRLRGDVQSAVTDLLNGTTLPATCNTLLTSNGITAASFTDNVDVFNGLPSGC